MLQLVLPMIVALVVIITLSSVQMRENAGKWIEPVKDRLVQEELKSLEVRAYERAQLVSVVFTSYKSSLEMVRNYTERLVDANGGLDLGNPLPAHFSANSMNSKGCPQGSLCRQARLEGCTRMVDAEPGERRVLPLELPAAADCTGQQPLPRGQRLPCQAPRHGGHVRRALGPHDALGQRGTCGVFLDQHDVRLLGFRAR